MCCNDEWLLWAPYLTCLPKAEILPHCWLLAKYIEGVVHRQISCGLPAVPHCVDMKGQWGQHCHWNQWPRLSGRPQLPPWLTNWLLSCMDIAQSRGSCHLLTSLGCQVLPVLSPKHLSNLSLSLQHWYPWHCSGALTPGTQPPSIFLSIHPLFWPEWSF